MGNRRPTAHDLAKLPGLEITEGGYSYDGPTGRVRPENCSPGDECFGSKAFGLLNIAKAWRHVNRSGRQPLTLPINDGVRRNIAKFEYDQRVVQAMTPQRRDEPVLVLIGPDGLNVIDGIHRLQRRLLDRLPDLQAFLLRPHLLREFQIKVFEQKHGTWHQTGGLTDDQLNEQIRKAELVEKMMFPGEAPTLG
jgi:hypothetical protein